MSNNLRIVDDWIGRCLKDHTKCGRNRETWYPTRLLCLSEVEVVKLIISKHSPPKGPYVTLSHRWPNQPFTKLNSSTIVQLQHGIDISSLPHVFQDAITVARHLHINYLWIDALCILQDQDHCSDWKEESQNMDKVYSCAFLNISATMAIDGTESLFQERSWGSLLPSEIELEVSGLNQKYYVQNGNLWHDEIIDAPLSKRGWVFQERFLACRVLHFGQHQLGWECQELDALEVLPKGLAPASAISIWSKSEVASMMANLNHQSDETLDLRFANLWQELVTEYSKCKLTYPQDKLVAFLGVAKRVKEAKPDHYVDGMWRKGMSYDLAWWRLSEDREAFPISNTSGRAPSWSWASVDGEIVFPSTFGGVKRNFIDILDSSELVSNECFAFSPPASIRIKGQCLLLSFEGSNDQISGLEVAGFSFPVSEEAQSPSLALEASDQEVLLLAQQGRVLFLPLFATSYFLNGLVITETLPSCAHRRLGALEVPIRRGAIEEDDPNSGPDTLQTYVRAGGQSTGRLNASSEFWSVTAVRLLHHLLDPARVQRIIDIE